MNKVQGTRPGAGADVVVVGEALIDIVVSSRGTVEHPGGSPANVAYGLGRLNVPTALLTSIGDDHHGAAIERHLASAGVELLTAAGRSGRTATATATLASDGSAQYDFDIQWELPAIAPVTVPKILHTGSIATFLEPGASAVRELLEQVHQRCVVTYDPNVRPALLGSQTEAKTIFEDLIPLIEVVKLSDEDARWLYPGWSLEDTSQRILDLGAGLVVVTKGSEGSMLSTPGSRLLVPSLKSTVVDTIGAGDSYMSALIYGLLLTGAVDLRQETLESLGRRATKAAAITVRRAGANPPTSDELLGDVVEHQPAI
ncbi:carbohydrate kinase [Arthrobacter sp. MYb23]|uniref:carbohydrate kinase family protein n=1 Tax=unclassified Arthrobacter TaxID=235627 RepID=UPI000CFB6619|nr:MULTISPECIES: carbohydrate kinase [unclassified Arthrobacter]PRB40586.1 carbohydrate kinase [Arthrobacter sp. MYb51]PRB94015.1 carbohydrate kinase [Arthrobacter sp. MYb23]